MSRVPGKYRIWHGAREMTSRHEVDSCGLWRSFAFFPPRPRGPRGRLLEQLGQHPDGLREPQDFALTQLVDLLMEQLYLKLRLHIDPVVILRGPAIDVLLPVLAHHDDRRGVGRLERKREIEENERVGVPTPDRADQVGGYPDEQDSALDDDETPRSHDGGDRVRYPLPRCEARDRRRLILVLKTK